MSFLSLLLSLSLITLLVNAAPTPENLQLARKYAPQFRFHKDESYFPSTVEYFLAGVKVLDAKGGSVGGGGSGAIGTLPNGGVDTYLSTDVNAGIQGFLRGQNPSTTATSTYVFIAPKANGVVDLYYWIFCPYNLAKSVPLLGEIGDHVGDWERITVRTVNGVATQVDYHAHSDTGSGTIPWSQVPKFDNDQRPAAYVAKGSHGMWVKPGTFTYVNAIIFKLQDETSDNGVAWDTKDSLVAINYPESYSDSLAWLNFKGLWGNKGDTNCWWHSIYKECKNVDGPNGPLRDDVLGAAKVSGNSLRTLTMLGPLSHTLAEVSSSSSEFTFYVDVTAASPNSKFISVEQKCKLLNETTSEYEDSTSEYASTSLSTQNQYTVSLPPCSGDSVVSSYTLGLCSSSDVTSCSWSTPRNIRAFSTEVEGVQDVAAVIVHDLDVWKLV